MALGHPFPWPEKALPENVILAAEKRYFSNERVISALLAHLAEHIVIGEGLRSVAESARRRVANELLEIPPVMVEFVNHLMAAGVVVDDVRKMPKKRLASVVAAIKGVDPAAVMDDVEAIPGKSVSSHDNNIGAESGFFRKSADGSVSPDEARAAGEPDASAEAGTRTMSGERETAAESLVSRRPEPYGRGSVEGEGTGSMPRRNEMIPGDKLAALEPVGASSESAPGGNGASDSGTGSVPVGNDVSERVFELQAPPVPKGPWSDLDLTKLGYRIEEATASTDADMEALRMKLPEVFHLRDLALKGTTEYAFAEGTVSTGRRDTLAKFVDRYSQRTGHRVTEAEKRMWGLLLVDLPTGGLGPQLGAHGWYHGLSIPGEPGSTRVRRIVAIGVDEESRRDAYSA